MLEEGAVDAIAGLAKKGQDIKELVGEVGGHTMSTRELHHIPPKGESEPKALALSSLSALVEYVAANRDEVDLTACVVQVVSPTSVYLRGPLTGEKRQRFSYVVASCKDLVEDFLGRFHGQTEFVIGVQTRFTGALQRAQVLQVVGTLREEQALETEDDGTTQKVTAKAGVHLRQQVDVPNPVELAPFRTFLEVEQPASNFVLRVQPGPRCALFEADGGAWELKAVERIAEWLDKALKDVDRELPILR